MFALLPAMVGSLPLSTESQIPEKRSVADDITRCLRGGTRAFQHPNRQESDRTCAKHHGILSNCERHEFHGMENNRKRFKEGRFRKA